MPEESTTMDLHTVLDLLEDRTLDKPIARSQNYRHFQNALENKVQISSMIADRLLAVCIQDLKEDKQYSHSILKIINSILIRAKTGDITELKNLLPSLLEIINMLKTTASLTKMETLQMLTFQTILSYPDNILVDLTMLHSEEVIEVISLYCHEKMPQEIRCLPYELILKILQVLPKERQIILLKENLKVWFTRVIPSVVYSLQNEALNSKPLDTLEALSEGLVHIDYAENVHWQYVLECICNPQKYPLIMKNMLLKGSKLWHRLWMVFIRLLKHQVTRSNNQGGTPINSMLPVVETAFKMDIANRCRAFESWDVLIDNFHRETNEGNIVKKVKLLIIPLKSNNAKVEETALAKLNTWWNLIKSFQTRIDKFADAILIPFLHFCFGKHGQQKKQIFVPCLISDNTKKRAVETFIELSGHISCDGCVDVPKLSNRLISNKLLVDYWNDWIFSLKMAISISTENVGVTKQQITCVWKSLVLIVAELPDNNIRKDLFDGLILVLETMCETKNNKNSESEILLGLITSLFGDDNIKPLLKYKGGQERPLLKIIKLLAKPSLDAYYSSKPFKDIILTLKPITDYILNGNLYSTLPFFECILNLPRSIVIFLWTAICGTLYDAQCYDYNTLEKIVKWPLYPSNCSVNEPYLAFVWYKLLELSYPIIKDSDVINEIKCKLWTSNDLPVLLKLYGTLVILSNVLNKDEFEKPVKAILDLLESIEDYNQIEIICKPLTDNLISALNKVILFPMICEDILRCVKRVMKLIIHDLKRNNEMEKHLLVLRSVLSQLDACLGNFTQAQLNYASIISKELIQLTTFVNNQQAIKNILLCIMKTCMLNMKQDCEAYNDLKAAIFSIEYNVDKSADEKLDENDFSTPNVKIITRKAKKREASIINTVMENGEEFIVVKSNWKFNPKKLTENQKEKLQRKREDIPALYQDLSQSQDEFKLNTWKTDSQDSSSTNSKSTSATKLNVDDGTNILKNIPSSDVVPKIIENILSDSSKKVDSVESTMASKPSTANHDLLKQSCSPKDAKSPRMALKDRVFRNVRNLIEKSGAQKDNKDLSESLVQIENIPKTPASNIKDNNNLINSAPPKIDIKRPSRVKRKPKKFDDAELFALKRNQRSSSRCDTSLETGILSDPNPEVKPVTENMLPLNADDVKRDSPSDTLKEKPFSNILINFHNNEAKHDITVDSNIGIGDSETSNISPTVDSTENNKKAEAVNKDKQLIDSECTSVQNNVIHTVESDIIIEMEQNLTKQNNVNTFSQENNSNASPASEDDSIVNKEKVNTPKSNKRQENSSQKSSTKKIHKISRIEKELAIDTVEGHPLLKINSERRMTRKHVSNSSSNSRRKSLTEKTNKSKSDHKTPFKSDTPNSKKKDKRETLHELKLTNNSVAVIETQEIPQSDSQTTEDFPLSEDIIESSQESTFTTISAASTKTPNKKVIVLLEKYPSISSNDNIKEVGMDSSQNVLSIQYESDKVKDDSDFPQNKTVTQTSFLESTENMDTEPIDNKIIELQCNSNDVIIINDDEDSPIIINTEDTQKIAEADTQLADYSQFIEDKNSANETTVDRSVIQEMEVEPFSIKNAVIETVHQDNEITKASSQSLDPLSKAGDEVNTVSSPLKDDVQRKKDFLDNTLEISPIKTMSPVRENKSPSPETSSDYVVIKLSSPVQSNGEPFEKYDSPEIFTEEKISPDKRELSPPRKEINANNSGSPSSSLSLKKNKSQVRPGGRAAQMLGLCVPDRLQTIINGERCEPEEPKKSSPLNTPARRNLRILYNTVGENNENSDDNDSENFLKFKKLLPTSDCSPSGPILKRKLAEIADDATITPASKRKRVSFHDPPVSTTVSVQKYIEPCGTRSPQNSALKRLERQNLRSQTVFKSQKRLDNVFKLDSVLTKAVESFIELDQTNTDDTQSMSLDETPAVEIIKNSDLNDTDPLCPDLIDCTDPIEVIACDLSSPTMKTVFLQELEGKLATVGDLAKMTELEVNRLCIKAPKVKIAKKVLNNYALKKAFDQTGPKEISIVNNTPHEESEAITCVNMDGSTQTNDAVTMEHREIQTILIESTAACIQTDEINMCHSNVQTEESGCKSTTDIISTCIAEKPDFVELLGCNLKESSKLNIAETLSFDALTKAFMKKVTTSNFKSLINQILDKQYDNNLQNREGELAFLRDYVFDRFENKDLILFCSQLLAKIHARPS